MSDYFFYDLNKKMADLASQQQLNENAAAAPAPKSKLTEAAADYSAKKADAGKDIGKPGKNFAKIAKGAATEADSIAVADSSLTIVTGVAGPHIQNIDMITNVVNGWFDVGDFTSTTVQLITSPGISGGAVIFEQTNDTTLAAAGSAIFGYDVAVATPTAPLFTINLSASTVRVIRFPLHCKYFRVRTSTAVLGGTAQVSMALSQRPLAHTANHVYSSSAANFSAMVSGSAGHASAATGNPVSVAGVVKTAVAAAGTNGNVSRLSVSASGANVTMPYSIPELDWQSSVVITTATDVTLKTAGGATVRNYCTNIDYINTSAVATTIIIKDGTTAIWTGYAPANMTLPASIAFIRPKKTAVNTAFSMNTKSAKNLLVVSMFCFLFQVIKDSLPPTTL